MVYVRGSGQKLLVIIASDADAEKLLRALVSSGYAATKIGSTGGFLRRGNTTIMSGIDASEVEAVLEIVCAYCQARTAVIPLQFLPVTGESAPIHDPMEVRVGGAVVFVLNVERFVKV
ncbi:MAG TPA: cyclic-di-AMP receptor [Dehalococcoidia bacterium]|nr:cyclic-di-AMP receptor [Dehalococcoidia bacterium]